VRDEGRAGGAADRARRHRRPIGGRGVILTLDVGFAGLFEDAGIFDEIVPDLVLRGVRAAMELNAPVRAEAAAR